MSEYDIKYTIPHIYSNNWLYVTEKQTPVEHEIIDISTGEKCTCIMYHSHVLKLKEDIYSILLTIYNEDGRLGNF